MNTNLLTIVKQIIATNGEGILENPQRLKAFFNDLAKDEPKPLRIAFVGCIENGAYNALKTAPDSGERASRKAAIAQRLRDDLGLDPAISGEALDILEAVLFGGQKQRQKLCKNCGKELQPEWKACPYCGMARTAARQPETAAPESPPSVTPSGPLKSKSPPVIENFVYIEGGTFMMGSPASEPNRFDDEIQHEVTVSSFYMDQYEVTQAEYQAVTGNNPSYYTGANLPVEQVGWYDAVEYCNKRSEREGLKPAYTVIKKLFKKDVSWNRNAQADQKSARYRLPTEAEWEYACRAGTITPFNTGNNITTSQANYNGNYPYNNNTKGAYREKTTAAGSFAPNRWGLYGMPGNVWEWCWDWYGEYSSGVQTDPVGSVSGSYRALRGGSWNFYGRYLRSAFRYGSTPSSRFSYLGFRLVRNG